MSNEREITHEAYELGRSKGEALAAGIKDAITVDNAEDIIADSWYDHTAGRTLSALASDSDWPDRFGPAYELGLITGEELATLRAAQEAISNAQAVIDGIINRPGTMTSHALYSFRIALDNTFCDAGKRTAEALLIAARGPAYEAGHLRGIKAAGALTPQECNAVVHAWVAPPVFKDGERPFPGAPPAQVEVFSAGEQKIRDKLAEVLASDECDPIRYEPAALVQYEAGLRDGLVAEAGRRFADDD